MTTQIQITSINILNSRYKFILNLIVFMILYICFTGLFTADCMNENASSNEIPIIAEAKPVITSTSNTKSIMHREISAFVGFAETIEEQKNIITNQQKQITLLEAKQTELETQKKELTNALRRSLFKLKGYEKEVENLKTELNIPKKS